MKIKTMTGIAIATLGLLATGLSAEITTEGPFLFPQQGPMEAVAKQEHPLVLSSPAPECPASLADSKKAVRVYVFFISDAKGGVREPKAVFGKNPDFDKAAVDAVQRWTFKPGVRHGITVNTQMYAVFQFLPTGK